MNTYTIVINDEQLNIIKVALKTLQRCKTTDIDFSTSELDLLVDMAETAEQENNEFPCAIQGWCY